MRIFTREHLSVAPSGGPVDCPLYPSIQPSLNSTDETGPFRFEFKTDLNAWQFTVNHTLHEAPTANGVIDEVHLWCQVPTDDIQLPFTEGYKGDDLAATTLDFPIRVGGIDIPLKLPGVHVAGANPIVKTTTTTFGSEFPYWNWWRWWGYYKPSNWNWWYYYPAGWGWRWYPWRQQESTSVAIGGAELAPASRGIKLCDGLQISNGQKVEIGMTMTIKPQTKWGYVQADAPGIIQISNPDTSGPSKPLPWRLFRQPGPNPSLVRWRFWPYSYYRWYWKYWIWPYYYYNPGSGYYGFVDANGNPVRTNSDGTVYAQYYDTQSWTGVRRCIFWGYVNRIKNV